MMILSLVSVFHGSYTSSHFFATGTVRRQDVELAERAGSIHVQPFVDAVAVKMVVTGKFS